MLVACDFQVAHTSHKGLSSPENFLVTLEHEVASRLFGAAPSAAYGIESGSNSKSTPSTRLLADDVGAVVVPDHLSPIAHGAESRPSGKCQPLRALRHLEHEQVAWPPGRQLRAVGIRVRDQRQFIVPCDAWPQSRSNETTNPPREVKVWSRDSLRQPSGSIVDARLARPARPATPR